METIKWVVNAFKKGGEAPMMALDEVQRAMAFHRSFPQYMPTPLVELGAMAGELGLKGLFVKDESHRFGLNAFKVLGGSYAIGRYIAQKTGRDIEGLDYQALTSPQLREEFGQSVFFTATDGNHGRGVAWAARVLGQRAVVRMPKGTAAARLENILKEGAKATIEDMNYDQCVRLAARQAQAENGVVIQDTAWEGYEDIPAFIMQGYGTMAMEAAQQLSAKGVGRPTHIFVQAGVGSLAGAVQGYFANLYPDDCPITAIVEPNAADCLYKSAAAGDGKPHSVYGDMQTCMAGLACGEPNAAAWEILKAHSTAFVSCPDWVSEMGMRMLAAPLRGDRQVVSGESGAVGMGLVARLMADPGLERLKQALKLDENSVVLLFSTEGDTDPVNYKRVVWGGPHG